MEKKTTSNNKKHSGGRPTKYKSEYVEQVYKLAVKGFIDKDIADFFKVQERTVNNWKDTHPEFFEALKWGKDEFDSNVIEASLRRRATGYRYKEKTQELSKPDPETWERKLITVKVVTKEIAPDPTSIIFWLKNRRPDRWRDKQLYEHGLTAEVLRAILAGLPKDFADGVRKELAKIAAIGRNKENG
jgi:hypothetical protein